MHPNLSTEINRNIVQSEVEGGVFLKDLSIPSTLKVTTRNTVYTIKKLGENEFTIVGNAKYCPAEVKAYISGSTWGGSMLKIGFIGRGMYLEFSTDLHSPIVTSSIIDVELVRD